MLKVHLEPAQATVTPGTGLILTVVVTNDGDAERTCRVRVVGLEAPWVEHSDGELTVPSGSRLEVPIRITLPLGYPRGETLVGFEVQGDGDERPMVVDTRLAVSDLESLNIGLSPVTVRGGWRGKFRLNIENRGTDPLTIKLTGRGVGPEDTKSDLDFTFKPERITLRPGERVKTRGSVSGKRHVFGNPRRRALTVTAQGETAPRHVQGAFVQRPLMPRNILRIVGLVLVLAMWAGGLTAGVKLTSGKGKSSAQDASAQIDPGAEGGPSGSDGTAAGGANGTGSEEAGVPAAGGAIAGQVKGPTDASGITVKLRPVALADDLSTDLAAQTVSFVSSSAEDAPKESAQTLRREPTGPVGPTATTTTDAEGKWAFGGLKTPANYEVTFSKAGFAERTYVVSVDDQAPTVALDVPMVPGNGSLSGTVKGPNGPLGGAVVTVTDGTVTFRATTPDSGDDAGKWSIDGLTTPATYMVSASLRGFGTESTSLALDSGGSKDGVDLTMVAGVGSISGHITGAGAKLGNITVTATNGDVTRTASTLTEGDPGAFSLPQLPIPGDYTISVTGDGWIPQTMALALKGNASKVDLDLVKTTATIVGTVRDSTGKSLASTGVTLAADKPIVKTLSAIDPAGTYELSGLAPGTYTLTFDRADFKSEATIVTVASGDRKTVDMTLTAQTGDKIPKDAVVRGIVRSSTTGNPIAGVQVSTGEVTSTSTATATASTTATTDSTGAFVLDKLAPGSYDLKFSSGHYQPLTRTLRIGAKSDTTIDVTMLILGGVQGLVTDLTATPLSGVTVTVTNDPAAVGQAAFSATTTTNSSGQYSLLEQLPTGKYVATFTFAGFSTRSRNFEAAAGTVAVGDIQLIELARIHGTIQTPDSSASGGFRSLSGVDILVERLVGSTWVTVQSITNNGGEYLITDLAPGDYRVTASKSGFGTSTKQIDDLQLREERDGGLVLAPGAQTVGGRITYDDHGVPAAAVGVTVTANIVTGFDTLTIFPFIQPHVSTLTTTTDSHGDWSITGQLSGTSGSYKYSGTGFTDILISSVTAPITAGSLDRTMVPNPRDLQGTLSLIGAPSSDLPSTNIRIAGGTTDVTVHPNTSGAYTFDDIPVGTYTMTLSGAGFQTRTVAVTVPPGAAATPVALSAQTLTKYSSITPTVRTGAGALLDGVAVSIGGAPQTTASGTTSFTSQLPGTYTITYSKAGYLSVTKSLTLAAGQDLTATTNPSELAVNLLKLPSLTLTVNSHLGTTSALNTATVTGQALDSGGNPTGAVLTTTRTGNDYVFAGLSPGDYRVTITAPDHDGLTVTSVTMVADTDQTLTRSLEAWSPLSVHLQSTFNSVTSDLTGVASNVTAVRTHDASGNAVTGQPTITFTESAGGIYTSANVTPGRYTITANPTTHVSGTVTSTVVAGTATTQSDLTLNQLGRISITTRKKLDGSFSSLTTATVTVTGPGGTATVTHTGGTNLYVADGLTAGSYTIAVSATDHDPQTFTGVAIAAAQSYTNTVDLLAWAPLSLHLQSHFGSTTGNLTSAASNVHAVRIKDAAGTTVTGQPTVNFTGGTGGIYTSSVNAQPGTYTITANPSTHVSGSVDAVSAAGDTPTQADLTIEQLPRITITTRSKLDGATSALNTATVTVSHSGGSAVTVTHAGGTNVYVADGLTPGNYDITVSRTDHDTQTFTSVAVVGGQDYTDTVDLLAWTPITLHLQSHFGSTTSNLTSAASDVTAVRIKDAAGATVTGQPTISFSGGTAGIYTSTINVVPGTYTITAAPSTHVSGSVDKATVAGTTPTDAQLTIEQKPRITITTRSRLDSVNTALNTAVVTVTGPGGTATVTHTGGTNVYVADGLTAGSYTITVSATDKDTQTFSGVAIANGDDYTNTVDLLAWTPITVHVQGHFGSSTTNLTSIASSVTAVRTLDANGDPVSSQPTIAFSGGTGGIYTSTTNVAPGTYSITGAPATHVSNSVTKVAVAGTTPTTPDLTLEQKPRITITTNSRLDGTNTAFNTATVTISHSGGSAVTVTHSGGTNVYVADTLTAGNYDITVSGTDKDTQTFTNVAIANGDDYTQTVNLLAWTPITVHVQGHFGSSTTNLTSIASSVTAVRTLDAAGGAVTGQPTITFTGGTGGIYTSSGNVTPGTYSITGAPATHVSNSVTKVAVAGTTPTTPDLTLEQLPRITITTNSRLDGTNTAFNTATVTITGPGGTATVTHTGGTNVYVANGLTPGTYDITVSGTDKDTQTFTGGTAVTVAGGDDYAQTVNLLAWTPIKVRFRGELNSVQTDLTSNAADLSAVRTLDANGDPVTGQPTVSFSGGTGGVYTSTINVTPGTYTITGSPANYDPNTVDVVAVAGTTPTQGLLIVQKLPALTVTVNSRLDSVDTDLTTATVTAQKLTGCGSSDSVGGNPVLTPGTVATNDYSFANLTAGCYKVIVSATNHVTQTFTNSTSNRVTITAGVAASLTVNLLKHPPLTLSLLGRNGSSSPFNTTFALPGATATMTATSGGSTTTLTDQGDGTYTKAVIVPGTYTLTVTAPNYGAMTAQTGIVIAAGVTHADLAGTLTATPGSITGTVRDSVTNNPIAGVNVTANFSGTPGRVATTDASGNYSITGLEPATWSVDYTKTTFSPLNVSVAVTAATASTSNQVLVQLGEEISGTVNGYATDPAVITSSTDNPKVPLAGALVTISRPGYTATQTSAADGTYTFADVPATSGANDYTIAFTHDKYVTRSVAKTTSVASSSSREDNLIAHTGTATVTVKDLEAGASPLLVQNAVIRVSGVLLATPLTDTSNASGVTSFHLPPGTYTASLVTPPSGYRASATTVPITVGPSSGVDGTTLLGTGTTSADYPISKAVSLDVNLTGLVNSDTATVTVSWDAGASTSVKTSQVNGHLTFTDLPPGKAFAVQATATHYTGGTGSSAAVTLGGTGTANAPLVADKAKVEVLVTGLLGADSTTVTLDGATSGSLTNGQSFTFNSVTPGVSQPLTFSNTNYDGSPASLSALDAGGDYTATDKKTLTLSPKDGRLLVTVTGLITGDEASIEVTWDAGTHTSGVLPTSGGLLTVANVPANKALEVTVTRPTNYTGPVTNPFTVTALGAKEDRAVPITLVPDPGTLHLVLGNMFAGDKLDASISCTGGCGGATTSITDITDVTGAAGVDFTNVPSNVTITITLAPSAGSTNTKTYTPLTDTTTIATAAGTRNKTITLTQH